MLHSDWFSLIVLVSANVSFSDMMQGDNGNIKVLLGIASFTDYIVIYLIYHCIVVFCPYNEMALYNTGIKGLLFVIFPFVLFIECVRSLECMGFVFLDSISVLPGIFCDMLDGCLID